MSAVRKKNLPQWVATAEKLAVNSVQNVLCPDCGRPALQVRDVEYGWGTIRGLERHMVCTNCGGYNIVNLRHAVSSGTEQTDALAK